VVERESHAFEREETPYQRRRRLRAARLQRAVPALAAVTAVLIVRLGMLQVGQAQTLAAVAAQNGVEVFATPPPRGAIYDRNDRLLAQDVPAYSLAFVRGFAQAPAPAAVARLATLVAPTATAQFGARVGIALHASGGPVYVLLQRRVSALAVSFVREHQSELPGFCVFADPMRTYPLGDVACHVLGYVNSIPAGQLAASVGQAGFPPDYQSGWAGVERAYDQALRGRPGEMAAAINSLGDPVRLLPERRPVVRGRSLRLTIDADYQAYVQRLLEHQVRRLRASGHVHVAHATAVALDPRSGEVLALASAPGFDPNWFVRGMSTRMYAQRFAPAERNWVTQAAIAPGSVMKPVTALFALARGVIGPATTFVCTGALALPRTDGTVIHCWTRHGAVDVRLALAESCDVFFYRTSLLYAHWPPASEQAVPHWLLRTRNEVLDAYEEFLSRFGLGRDSRIDLPERESGYLNRSSGQLTDIPYTAIGQNEVFTPLELAVYTARLATHGRPLWPHVVASQEQADGHFAPVYPPTGAMLPALRLPERDWALIDRGLWLACNSPDGTAYATFHGRGRIHYSVAGKTGTAETGIGGSDNAVFIGYAPAVHPQVAIVVVVPGGGHGSDSTGPIARAMFDRYFADFGRKTHLPRGIGDARDDRRRG